MKKSTIVLIASISTASIVGVGTGIGIGFAINQPRQKNDPTLERLYIGYRKQMIRTQLDDVYNSHKNIWTDKMTNFVIQVVDNFSLCYQNINTSKNWWDGFVPYKRIQPENKGDYVLIGNTYKLDDIYSWNFKDEGNFYKIKSYFGVSVYGTTTEPWGWPEMPIDYSSEIIVSKS